jgi:2,3-bisphosphoglycerate-dependent phosphoglycerate mutase
MNKPMKQLRFLCFGLLLLLGACQNAAAQQEAVTTFILVRHAEKASDGSKDPPLTATGEQRAKALAKLLSGTPIDAVFSSNYKRTRETARPLANMNKQEIQLYEPHQEKPLLEDLKKKYAGKTILMVGHSNTIPGVVNMLIGEEKLQELQDSEYDKVFVVSQHPDAKPHLLRLVLDLPAATQ